jgi:arylsulfatase A-like enzyme
MLDRVELPAIEIPAGEKRSVEVDVPPGSRLDFHWTTPGTVPGHLRFEVTADGEILFRKDMFSRERLNWKPVSLPLAMSGPTRIEMSVSPRSREAREEHPPVLVGAPRVVPPAGEYRHRRVLLWVSQDAVRTDHLSLYGYARPTTPEVDALAKGWTVFENVVAPASWTLPSFGSAFTSRFPGFHGADSAYRRCDQTVPQLFDLLGSEGFTVLGVSANALIQGGSGFRGFDVLHYASVDHSADEVNRLILASIDEWPGDDLVIFVHYVDAHFPYAPPEPFARRFDPEYRGPITTPEELTDPVRAEALYDAEIAYTDDRIRRLIETLRARGLYDQALVVYSADHGEEFQDHGGWFHSKTLFQEMLRVPLAFRVPGLPGGRFSQPVSLVDLAPTVLEVWGIPIPASFQGRSLLPLLRGGQLATVPLFAEVKPNPRLKDSITVDRVSVQEGTLKYIADVEPGESIPPHILREEVFDLSRDPQERSPLEDPEALERGRRRVVAYLSRVRARSRGSDAEATEDLEAALRALGYIE